MKSDKENKYMKTRKKDIALLVSFLVLTIGIGIFLVVHYTNWYKVTEDERKIQLAEEKKLEAQENKERAAREKERKKEERRAKKDALVEAALVNYRNIYQTRLNEYQASDEFDYVTDRYFLYDINVDGLPELFITSPEDGENYLQKVSVYTIDTLSTQLLSLEFPSELNAMAFYKAEGGIVISSMDSSGTLCYNKYSLDKKQITEKAQAFFRTSGEGGEWKYGSGDFEEYSKEFMNFHRKNQEKYSVCRAYPLGDTTPFDLFDSGKEQEEAVRTIQGVDSVSSMEYEGDLYFVPSTAQDLGDSFRVSGALAEMVYVPEKRVKKLQPGDVIYIDTVRYQISAVEEGIYYIANANICLRHSMEGISNASFYGEIPEGYYQVFRNDGTPYFNEFTGNIVLNFYEGAAICSMVSDELGNQVPYYQDIYSYFQTDYEGKLIQPAKMGRLCTENNLAISFEEVPR